MAHWKRPENVLFPSIWRTFERKGPDGVAKKFWVQDLTPEYEHDFFSMLNYFVVDESLCKYSRLVEDPQAVKEFTDLWKVSIKTKLAVICLTQDEHGKMEFVGGNMTCTGEKNQHFSLEEHSKIYQKIMSAVTYVTKKRDIFSVFNVNEYLTAYGLYVYPKFRGQGIGTEILKARRELCLAVGLKISGTLFTSIISQKNAQKAGFQEFVEMDYDDLENINPDWSFPGITAATKSIKFMCIKYE